MRQISHLQARLEMAVPTMISHLRTRLEMTIPTMVSRLRARRWVATPTTASPEAGPPELVTPIREPRSVPAESLIRVALAEVELKSAPAEAKPLALAIPTPG